MLVRPSIGRLLASVSICAFLALSSAHAQSSLGPLAAWSEWSIDINLRPLAEVVRQSGAAPPTSACRDGQLSGVYGREMFVASLVYCLIAANPKLSQGARFGINRFAKSVGYPETRIGFIRRGRVVVEGDEELVLLWHDVAILPSQD